MAAFAARGYAPGAAAATCADVLGREDAGVVPRLRFAGEEVVPRLRATTDELDHLLGGLQRAPRPRGPVGLADPRARRRPADRAQLLLGRPPGAALRARLGGRAPAGRRAAAPPPRRGRRLPRDGRDRGVGHGGDAHPRRRRRPRSSRCSACGRCGTPRRAGSTGLEPIALEELGRPRIDVTVRISGFFRDAFPALVTLLDDAVALVAGLDEPAESNFVRKHALADATGSWPSWARTRRGGGRRRASSAPSRAPTARG